MSYLTPVLGCHVGLGLLDLAAALSSNHPRGTPEAVILDGIRLLAETQWSTTQVEQGHASMAVVARFHPDLELTSLLLRSGLHQNRALFSSAAPLMSQKLALQQQRALQKQPLQIHAPQVFIKDVFDSVQLSSNIELDTSQAQELLHRAVAHFKGLQWHEKEHYRRRAELLQQQQLEDTHSRADDFQLQIMAALQEEAQEAQQLQGLCRLSNCKLSDVDIETRTQINMNTPFDCVVSRPSSSSAAAFCEKVGVQKMHSYAFSLYGEEGSRILASETANIYQHFYDVWCGAGD